MILLGVLAVSLCWGVGGPLSWVALQTLPAAETAAGRCFFAFLGLLPFLVLDGRGIATRLTKSGRLLLVSSGLLLGVHFYFFVAGVAYASLMTAITLVAVEPALVLLVGVVGFKEKLRLGSFFGILLCMGGIFVISVLPHLGTSLTSAASGNAYGDLCAVLAVVTYGIYYGLNRAFRNHERAMVDGGSSLRRAFGLASLIYLFAAISSGLLFLVSTSVGSSVAVMPTQKVWVSLAALGLIPTVLGHTLNQMVSRSAHPVWVSLMSPGETLMALLMGYVFLDQAMHLHQAVGGAFILTGVLITAWNESRIR